MHEWSKGDQIGISDAKCSISVDMAGMRITQVDLAKEIKLLNLNDHNATRIKMPIAKKIWLICLLLYISSVICEHISGSSRDAATLLVAGRRALRYVISFIES